MFLEGKALEFLIAAVVALVVVGPKDLPILLRKFGQFMARVRAMAAEFRASFDEMARQSELDELRKEVEAMRQGQLADIAAHTTSPEMTQTFNEISQGLSDVGVSLDQPVAYPYTPAQTEHVDITPAKPARKARAKQPAARAKAAGGAKRGPAKTATATAAKAKPAPKALAAKAVPPAKPKVAAKPAAKAVSAKPAAAKPRVRKASVS
ncbi:Sec-independent protein translocase protein TatB [Phenylobacterium sp.]|jgi:sec-independent protein translocase protein TatB|uniref:Sec-independent protein translocase protein TatB n=1 Tax=Phenylobacterium sp. TaxID=1871053 RepID=UPI002F42C678